MLSVAAVQVRSIWVALAAVAPTPVGAVGGVVSGAAGVVADEMFEYGPVLRAIVDAAGYDARVEQVYRYGLIERLVAG